MVILCGTLQNPSLRPKTFQNALYKPLSPAASHHRAISSFAQRYATATRIYLTYRADLLVGTSHYKTLQWAWLIAQRKKSNCCGCGQNSLRRRTENIRLHLKLARDIMARNMLVMLIVQHRKQTPFHRRGIEAAYVRMLGYTKTVLASGENEPEPLCLGRKDRKIVERMIDRVDKYVKRVALALSTGALTVGTWAFQGWEVRTDDT